MRDWNHILLLSTVVLTTIVVNVNEIAFANTLTNGFLITNPWLDDAPGGVGWTFNSPWEFESGINSGTALFVTGSSNLPGTYSAEASSKDLTTESNVTALDGYDPSTTKLTSLSFANPWRVGHYGTVPTDGSYNVYAEFTIDTPGGSYRASSQKLDRPTAFQNTASQLGLNFNWEGGGFLGDPFAGSSGIPLDQINNVDYKFVVEVINPTTGGNGFFNVEGFNVGYEVKSALGITPDLNTARDDQINRQRDYILDSILPTGLVRDSLVLDGPSFHPATPDAAGFALVGLSALDHLGKLANAEQHVIDILSAHLGQIPGIVPARSPEGHFTHYMNVTSGAPEGGDWDPSYTTIGTALLVAGAQFASNHFPNNSTIASLTEQLTDSVNFNAAIDPDLSGRIYRDMTATGGGTPGVGNTPWNEYMIVVSLALREDDNARALAIKDLWLDPDNLPTRSYAGLETLTDCTCYYAPAFWTQQQHFFNGDFRHNAGFEVFLENLKLADQSYSSGVLGETHRYGLTAGPSPQGYSADRIENHPFDVFSPEAVAAWGDMDTFLEFYVEQFPTADPRYRYGLLRESAADPNWVPFDVGLVDHLFLLFGLVESIDPDFFAERVIPEFIFGDFEHDGDVDGLDFLEWQKGLGTKYDSDDLVDWQANYGSLAGLPLTAMGNTVPEPKTLILVLATCVVFLLKKSNIRS